MQNKSFLNPLLISFVKMKIKVVEDKKTRLILEVEGESHTLCNALKKELWNDSHVKAAGYNISHPYVGVPTLIVETDTQKSPRKALEDAAKRISKEAESFNQSFSKAVK